MTETNHQESWGEFLNKIHPYLSYPEVLSMARRVAKFCSDKPLGPEQTMLVKTKIALMGNHTLSFARAPLELFLARHGIRAEWFIGEFNNYKQELLSDNSPLYAFEPQIVILSLDHHAVNFWPATGDNEKETQDVAMRQLKDWEFLWSRIKSQCGASVVHSNIVLPHEQILGHYEAKAVWGATHYLRRLNNLIAERSPSHVSICDAEHLSNRIGKRIWFNETTWYTTRQGLGFEALISLSYNLASIVGAILGKSRKCLVLDLDDTLWGGIVGDVGIEGIKLGRGDPLGEAFIDFQTYCHRLKEQGVLLAACSKNNFEEACAPFQNHPEMVLRLDDFAAFTANWKDKVSNIRQIASDLNLGTDSLVFVDDNPAERALVKKYLPEVAVPEMPDDPVLFRRTLYEHHFFEIVGLSKEDLVRTSYYLAERKRKQVATSVTDITDFLKTLEQECETGPFNEINLQRIVQLINKTNQWNLTTQRLTEGEVRTLMAEPSYFTLWVRHRDKFGDNGLISVLIARHIESNLDIEGWLMSCRVINRGIEDFVFNEVLDEARRRSVVSITGTYRPTAKNGMVAKLYRRLGFKPLTTENNGVCKWSLNLSDHIDKRVHFIRSATIKNKPQQGGNK